MKLVNTKALFQKPILVFILMLSNMAYAQDSTNTIVDSLNENNYGKYAITVAYYGETVTHPGLNLGVEYSLWAKKKIRLISSANIGWYTHPRHHRAAFFNVETGIRSTTSFGLYSDFFFGVGYNHSWVNGDVYVSDGEDDVKIIKDKGHARLMLNGSLGLGWNFLKNNRQPLNVFVRVKPLFIFSVNNNMLIQAALMTGVIWSL
jgi:hypothetical protein